MGLEVRPCAGRAALEPFSEEVAVQLSPPDEKGAGRKAREAWPRQSRCWLVTSIRPIPMLRRPRRTPHPSGPAAVGGAPPDKDPGIKTFPVSSPFSLEMSLGSFGHSLATPAINPLFLERPHGGVNRPFPQPHVLRHT